MAKDTLSASSEGIEIIRNRLKRLKKSQTQLAIDVFCSRETISSLLRGNPIQRETLESICTELKLNLQDIIEPEDRNITDEDLAILVNQLREQVKPDIETRCGTMRILDMSQPIGLNDIYTKVNILEKINARRRKGVAELIENYDAENFDRFNFGQVKEKIPGKKAVSKYSKLLILGKLGAGKTTFLKHLAIQCNRGLFQGNLVPFFITLKEFAETSDRPNLFDYLYLYPPSYLVTAGIDSTALHRVLSAGKALICLDGLDEVLAADSKRIIKEIESLVRKYPQNQYLMTCRIAAKEYTFTQFTEVEIADFDREQISIFATNWFKNKPIKPETFLSRLENDEPIQELASNPLLLTLLCLVFEESGSFPGNRAALYKEGINALLKKWDAKRGIQRDEIYQKLWSQRKEDLLSKLAWETFSQGEYFFKQDKAERLIGEYIRNLPGANTDEEALKLDSEVVLKSIESQYGLLVERAKGIYSFSHLTFQEYFAAREIIVVRQSSDEVLEELVSHLLDKRWREVFLLGVAMSPNAKKLVLFIKNKIDNLLANDEALQLYLEWLNKNKSFNKIDLPQDIIIDFKAMHKFYVDRNATIAKALLLVSDLSLNIGIEQSPLHIDFKFEHNIDFLFYTNFDMLINLLIDLDPDDRLFVLVSILFNEIINLAEEQDDNFHQALLEPYQQLRNSLLKNEAEPPDEKNISVEAWNNWWKEEGKKWLVKLMNIAIKHRNIYHDWRFEDSQKILLEQYYFANHLLTECLHQDCYVTPEVRQEIEDTLLLPIAEIEKRKPNLSN